LSKPSESSTRSELLELADELGSWQTKRRSEWTPDEHAAYQRWSRRELERMGTNEGPVEFVMVDADSDEHDRPPHTPGFEIKPERQHLAR
jgi:hypothetical protein